MPKDPLYEMCGHDHAVMHAERKIRSLVAKRRLLYVHVTELINRIELQALTG